MSRELYLYWHTKLADLPAATAAMRTFQHRQVLSTPSLQARLLQRVESTGAAVTLMETYALPATAGGIGEALQQRIIQGGDAASAPWRDGARHVEVFSETGLVQDRSSNSGPG